MPADLHVHTSHSDSTLTPSAVIAACLVHGIHTVAITDHDSVDGVASAMESGRAAGLRVIPGVEMTVYDAQIEVHIVGLFVDTGSERLNAVLWQTLEARRRRIYEIVARLNQIGVEVSADDVFTIAGCGSPGRPHVAQALVRSGYVPSVADAFRSYLANGAPGYVPKQNLRPSEAVVAIHEAGGVAILAHPGVGLGAATIERLLRCDVDGVEVYHPLHSEADTVRFRDMARERGLLVSGGSDSHGGIRPETEIGAVLLPDDLVDKLEARAGRWFG